jgi:hypothetical protein
MAATGCSVSASLGGLGLIWRQAYIEALVWFDPMFDVRPSRIDLVFASWSFERLSGLRRSFGCRRSGSFLVSPSVLVFTISISKLAYASGFYWFRALASCSSFRALLAPCPGYYAGWAPT